MQSADDFNNGSFSLWTQLSERKYGSKRLFGIHCNVRSSAFLKIFWGSVLDQWSYWMKKWTLLELCCSFVLSHNIVLQYTPMWVNASLKERVTVFVKITYDPNPKSGTSICENDESSVNYFLTEAPATSNGPTYINAARKNETSFYVQIPTKFWYFQN